MSQKHKQVFRILNYFEHILIFFSGCVSISAFVSLLGVCTGIASYSIWLKICAITSGIKKYKSIIKKKRKKHNNTMLLAKPKLNTTEVLISKDLIDSCVNHDKFVSLNVLKEYNELREEIKNPETVVKYTM